MNRPIIAKFRKDGWRTATTSNPLLLLTTRGARTGRERVTPLNFSRDGERYIVMASKGGSASHPDWYRNLQAHPDAFLVMDGQRHAVHARTAGAEEKAELWPKIVGTYKGYAGYQERTDRDIPVVICELQD